VSHITLAQRGATTAVAIWTANNTKSLIFTGALSSGATSATLSSSWYYVSGVYTVTFSDKETRSVTFTNGSTAVSWTGGLTSNVTNAASAFFCSSTFQTVASGVSQSCIDHKVFGGEWYNRSPNQLADVFYLDEADSTKIYGPWAYAAGPYGFTFTGALSSGATAATLSASWPNLSDVYTVTFSDGETRSVTFSSGSTAVSWTGGLMNNVTSTASALVGGHALVHVDMANAPSNYVVLDGITGEESGGLGTGGKQQYGVFFDNVAGTVEYWGIQNCKFPVSGNVLSSGASVTLYEFNCSNIADPDEGGIVILGTLQSSTMDVAYVVLDIAISKNNALIGYSENWSITTRSNDNWLDTGIVNKTWTPVIAAGNHGGILTINETRCLFSGNMVHVEFCMTDTVSISFTLAQTVTGLPRAALNRSAMVSVANVSTGAAIGAGFIQAGTSAIAMPAFSVGANVTVCVSASYFVA